jgi:cysteine synthase A
MSTCSVVYLSGMTLRTAALVRTARAPSRRVVRGMATAPPPCISASAADTIGNTPLVDCSRLVQQSGLTGRILAKLEFCNPGFSKKDRIAKQIIDDALMGGAVRPGDTVVELTSGNTGTGLAIVCAARGLRFVAVMSEGNSVERAHMMRALGAEVILVPQCRGSTPGQVSGADLALVDEVCRSVVQDRGAFRADQFDLDGSVSAHYNHTGPEFWAQSGGSIDAFVDFVGSGGTFAGCSKYLKQASGGHVACYIVEPENAVGVVSLVSRVWAGRALAHAVESTM